MKKIDWELNGCCETEEYLFMAFYGGYVIIFFLLWNTFILKPMRLLSVFVHEFGHASACWMTGGKVEGIEVYENEGGVTKYRGGMRCLVIPAGYVGGAFWGGAFVALSGNRLGATVVAGMITGALVITLWWVVVYDCCVVVTSPMPSPCVGNDFQSYHVQWC